VFKGWCIWVEQECYVVSKGTSSTCLEKKFSTGLQGTKKNHAPKEFECVIQIIYLTQIHMYMYLKCIIMGLLIKDTQMFCTFCEFFFKKQYGKYVDISLVFPS
jgi:hypothetical protein